jgi:hypothetical protein
MTTIEELFVAAMNDDIVRSRVMRLLPSSNNRNVAIDAAKKGYNSFLKAMSDDERITNLVRIECLEHIKDTDTKIYLIRDILGALRPKDQAVKEFLSNIHPHMITLSKSLNDDETLESALEDIDDEYD